VPAALLDEIGDHDTQAQDDSPEDLLLDKGYFPERVPLSIGSVQDHPHCSYALMSLANDSSDTIPAI
jgi:hypothetical protein